MTTTGEGVGGGGGEGGGGSERRFSGGTSFSGSGGSSMTSTTVHVQMGVESAAICSSVRWTASRSMGGSLARSSAISCSTFCCGPFALASEFGSMSVVVDEGCRADDDPYGGSGVGTVDRMETGVAVVDRISSFELESESKPKMRGHFILNGKLTKKYVLPDVDCDLCPLNAGELVVDELIIIDGCCCCCCC